MVRKPPHAGLSGKPGSRAPLPLFHQLEILDHHREQNFDRILALAADLFDASLCGILVQKGKRYWHKMSGQAIATDQVPSDGSFTRYTMRGGDIFFVSDAALDPRFRNHPRVAGPPGIRFYIGAPLIDEQGRRVGALAVMDNKPREPPSSLQRRLVRQLADDIMMQIQARAHEYTGELLRASEARLDRSQIQMAQAQRLAQVGSGEVVFATGERYWSDQMYSIFGVTPGVPVPSADEIVRFFVHPEDRARIAENHRNLMRGELAPRSEYRIIRPDGQERTLLRFGEISFDKAGKPIRHLVAVQDVTELRAAERDRDEYQRQLHHAQRLDALGTLAGGIAHDLNNTLVPILALTKMMRAAATDDDARGNLDVIHRAGERARDLVQRVLTFSRKMPPRRHAVDVGAAIAESLTMLRASINSRIRLEQHLTSVIACVDPGQIDQVVVNLVTNAAQAIGDGPGTVSISLEPVVADAPLIRLVVEDDGNGMDEATMARMFEPFFTTRGLGAGAGLGLSIVHGIVTGHGGRIAARSIPGDGTRMTIELPMQAQAIERAPDFAIAAA